MKRIATSIVIGLIVGAIVLGGLFVLSAVAGEPIKAIFPPCRGGEVGFWQPYVQVNEQGDKLIYMVILNHELLDPANVICWLTLHQKVTVLPSVQPGKGVLPALRK